MDVLYNTYVSAAAVRLLLSLLSIGKYLIWKVEVSTPANTILQVREGLRLKSWGVAPYSGSSCHAPPLVLALLSAIAHEDNFYVLPNIIFDLLTGALVAGIAATLLKDKSAGALVTPQQLSAIYLWNPFSIASCISGSLTSLENLAVMVAAYGAVKQKIPTCMFGLALGCYLSLSPALLLLPCLLLLLNGPEHHHTAAPPSTDIKAQDEPSNSTKPAEQQQNPAEDAQAKQQDANSHGIISTIITALMYFILWLSALIILSDIFLRDVPQDQCIPKLPTALHQLYSSIRVSNTFPYVDLHIWDLDLPTCWIGQTWGFILLVKDYTPNIGLHWYFFLEMFQNFTPFFKFVFHSHAVIMALPLAIRLGHRPFFLLWCQLLISCLFRPYPTVGDLVPYLTLLPLLHAQLQHMKMKLFLMNAFLLLAVLGPAMFHQWIELDAANSNYFYSITLGIAVWQILLLVQMIIATIRVDRIAAGKMVDGDDVHAKRD